jgi:hypothetical protein
MTGQQDLDRALDAWCADEALAPPPTEPLVRVLAATSHLRPRPALVAGFGSHWIDDATYGARAEAFRLRPLLVLALVALLTVALVGAAAIVGGRLLAPQPAPLPDGVLDELVSVPGLSRPMARPVLAPLPDGRVLVMGAGNDGEDQTPSAELYDAAAGTSVPVGPMVPVQWVASATPLRDGRVLIIGGEGQTQIFEPDTLRFSPVGAMVTPRRDGTLATLLGDGRVLVVGGGNLEAELFQPDTLTFSKTGAMAAMPVESPALAILPDGRVFVPAGLMTPDGSWWTEAEIYDPTTETFRAAGRTPDLGAAEPIAMPDGRVLLLGSRGISGRDGGQASIWDPATRDFSPLADPWGNVSRATLLDDGRILMLGYVQFPRDRTKCQVRTEHACSWAGIYDPATGATAFVAPPTAWQPSLTRLTDGRVLVVGGLVNGENGPAPAGDSAPAVPTVQVYH